MEPVDVQIDDYNLCCNEVVNDNKLYSILERIHIHYLLELDICINSIEGHWFEQQQKRI